MDIALRVLIIEDNPSWQQLLKEILEDIGLVVDIVDSYECAVDAIHRSSHKIAIVDLALGNGDVNNHDGLRLLDVIKRLDPGCLPIMLTGYATVELAVRVLKEYGAFSCLEKSGFSRIEFRKLIQRALATPPAILQSNLMESHEVHVNMQNADGDHTIPYHIDKVLVVEDDAGWRSILSEILVDAGFTVQLCNGYGEALGYLYRDSFALAVVDLNLGQTSLDSYVVQDLSDASVQLNGYKLLSELRALDISSIVVSGLGAPERIARLFDEEGVYAFLEKQHFSRKVFLETVLEALNAHQIPGELACLTEREFEVLQLLAQGSTNKDIADKLFISTNTVKRHLKAIFEKLDVHTRAAAAAKAVQARNT